MRAVWVVLVAGFRRQWRSWLLLSLLIAVASRFVLASTAAGRRTDSAFPRYVASHGYDAIVYTVQPLPKELEGDRAIGRITLVSLPAVTVNRINVRTIAVTVVRGPMLLSAADGRLPAGDDQIALGAIWRAFAISLGVVPVPVAQAWLIVALAAGALIAANALAAVPAMSAARSRPGQLLRTE